jgi:hypothetical protein
MTGRVAAKRDDFGERTLSCCDVHGGRRLGCRTVGMVQLHPPILKPLDRRRRQVSALDRFDKRAGQCARLRAAGLRQQVMRPRTGGKRRLFTL